MSDLLRPATSDAGAGPAAGTYVYCIARLDRLRDFGGTRRVYTVHHRDLAAVVRDVVAPVNVAAPETCLDHEVVNEAVMREGTALPMPVGMVLPSDADVAELLRSMYAPLADVLDRVRDKVEYELEVLWDRERVAERVEREDAEIRRLVEDIERHADTSTYYARQELDRLVRAAVDAAANRYATEVNESLKPVAAACRSNGVVRDRVLLDVAVLVDRAGQRAFDERVREVKRRYGEVLTVRCTGPWPPYNFVNLKLGHERRG